MHDELQHALAAYAAVGFDAAATADPQALAYQSILRHICTDIKDLITGAAPYHLLEACKPTEELREQLQAVADGTALRKDSDWHGVASLRIGDSWRSKRGEFVWMDDKFIQIEKTTEACGQQLHLPLLALAASDDEPALRALRAVTGQCAEEGRAVVVKPRHGANSACVFMFRQPTPSDQAALSDAVDKVVTTYHHTWAKENWQLSQVPRGVLVQPLYRTMLVAHRSEFLKELPLELRVIVVFGVVVGASITAYPFEAWVTHDGFVHHWDNSMLKLSGVPASQKHGKRLPPEAIDALRGVLLRDWGHIRSCSEAIVRHHGLDELRVDWLVGDEDWGSRIGELTYMGTGGSIAFPSLSRTVATAYARRLLSYWEM
eukprot:TRINITY_DN92255_c0_g1_i1.p1 TRINITY_DN92255_c0_g1~~TRINITY_DN92255_c0_g1_i1.p1  ORF type:complete len:374 (-),score=87.88 TRINITY_DN92255_c0_g1_i1:556-1677(-)